MQPEDKVAEKQDMHAAEESYERFISIFKWGTVLAGLTTILVILILAT
jgi:hypothetical protein